MGRTKKVIGVIPSRYGSTRLLAKALADIHGKPLVQWVYEKAIQSKHIHSVVIATDDERIFKAAKKFGAEVLMTSQDIASGTDRVAAVADQVAGDVFVNIQGDEPLITSHAIDHAIELVLDDRFQISTLKTPFRKIEDFENPNCVKVLTDHNKRAIYFSRLPIPYSRGERPKDASQLIAQRHVGLYVYQREALMKFRSLGPSLIEKGEVLEQLRALEAGLSIGVAGISEDVLGVDTPDDLERVRAILLHPTSPLS